MKVFEFLKKYWLLLTILVLASSLRLTQLDQLPSGVFCDEANIGYSAYSLLKTGADEYGVKLPIFFQGFGDYRLPLPIYLQLPTISILGLNTFSIRFTVALIGILTVFIFYKIGEIAINRNFGLITALILAISPWHIHMTRNAMEWSYPIIFFSASILFFLLSNKNKRFIYLGAIFIALSIYSYYSAVLIAPLFFFIVFIYFLCQKTFRKEALLSLLIFLVICLPFIDGVIKGTVTSRFKTIAKNEKRLTQIDRLKGSALIYVRHFDPNFLFFHTQDYESITRHSIKNIGQLSKLSIILLPFGFWSLLMRKGKTASLFKIIILTLLILYPLPSLLNDNNAPMPTRSILGIIPLNLIAAMGLYNILDYLKNMKLKSIKYMLFFILITFFFIESSNFYTSYFKKYSDYSSDFWGWQYGPSEIIKYFKTHKDSYDELYMTGFFNAPEIFLKFYDPEHSCKNCFIGGIDKYDARKNQLFAMRIEEVTKVTMPYAIKKVIYYPNGVAAFYLVEF